MIMMHVDNLKLITQCFILYTLQAEAKAFQYRMRLRQDALSILVVSQQDRKRLESIVWGRYDSPNLSTKYITPHSSGDNTGK